MRKCWDVMHCDRQRRPGMDGEKACVVSRLDEAICWLVAGPQAPPENQCMYVQRGRDCMACRYFHAFHEDLGGFMTPGEVEHVRKSWCDFPGLWADGCKEPGGRV